MNKHRSIVNIIRLCLVSFICILRYQSFLPRFQHCCQPFLIPTYCLDRTLSYLIVRLKAFWLTLLTIVTCLSLTIIFRWPKLHYDVCRITFDTLPNQVRSSLKDNQLVDIDITYYIGSHWRVSNESMIPSNDIPILDFNMKNKITSSSLDASQAFADALEHNLRQLIDSCLHWTRLQRYRPLIYRQQASSDTNDPSDTNE
jgi:hypothetical protein